MSVVTAAALFKTGATQELLVKDRYDCPQQSQPPASSDFASAAHRV